MSYRDGVAPTTSYRDGVVSANSDLIACDVNQVVDMHMLNGTSCDIAIPCRYVVNGVLVPIDLVAEGYVDPILALDSPLDGLTWRSEISPTDNSVINLVLDAICPSAIDRDVSLDVSLLITRNLPDSTQRTDSVIRGRLLVVASPIPA